MAHCPDRFYKTYYIKKSSGGKRKISEPTAPLKYIQKCILDEILKKNEVSEYATAYINKRSVKDNAQIHQNQKIVLSLDIKDFFPSIRKKHVVEIFNNMGYSLDVSHFLSYLCCYDCCLPQGAPTSPYLSNLYMLKFDLLLSEYTKQKNINYTRYADDITLSGDFDPHEMIKIVREYLKQFELKINSKKTRIARQNARQETTGIVVNSHMQISKTERKKIRQQMYYIKKFGIKSHMSYIHKKEKYSYLCSLYGKINFALYINPNDKELKDYCVFLTDLLQSCDRPTPRYMMNSEYYEEEGWHFSNDYYDKYDSFNDTYEPCEYENEYEYIEEFENSKNDYFNNICKQNYFSNNFSEEIDDNFFDCDEILNDDEVPF